MKCQQKYVRFVRLGFVMWPASDLLIHADLAKVMKFDRPVSAGFVDFINGVPKCSGKSVSLDLGGRLDDDEALAAQLGIVVPVESESVVMA